MSWIGEMADRAAGALQGARDTVRGIEYEAIRAAVGVVNRKLAEAGR